MRLLAGKGGLFGHPPNDVNDVLGGISVQTSVYGQPIPILYGRRRISGNLIWYGNFQATPQQHKGGKGGLFGSGGKGGQQQYDYAASVMIGICQGLSYFTGAVWDTQGTLPVNDTTETYTIGGGLTYTATQQNTYLHDLGVTIATSYSVVANDYGSPGTITLSGVQQTPLTKVSGSPGANQYSESGGVYHFNSANTGAIASINYSYGPPNSIDADPIVSYNLSFFDGAQGQTPWTWLTSYNPSQAIGYSYLAYVATSQMDLGDSGVLPNLSFEVGGLLPYGNGTYDCNPRDVFYDIMTNTVYGASLSSSDLGGLSMPNWAPNYSNYCIANGLFMSPLLADSQTLSDYMDDWLAATNAQMFRNGWALTIATYGDTTAVGNGVTFTPNTSPIYNLTDDAFIRDGDSLPIQIERPSQKDAYNQTNIQFTNRSANYNEDQVQATDQGAIDLYKLRPESQRDYDFFTSLTPASLCAQTLLAAMVYVRNKWKFVVSWPYILLDPMDLVTLPAVPETGNVVTGVRITRISEAGMEEGSEAGGDGDPKTDALKLSIEAEDFPWGNLGPTLYPKQPSTRSLPNASADPGYCNPPIIFEAIPRLRGTDPNQELWIGLCGNSVTVGFSGGGGTGAAAYAIIENGEINRVVMIFGGSGYTSAPTVSFGNSNNLGSGATGTATYSGGEITGVTVTAGGSGWVSQWGGAQVWMSTDGDTYYPVATQFGASIMGITTADWPAASDPDSTNNLTVDLSESGGVLASFSETQENNFASLFLVSGGYGNIEYELAAYAEATLVSGDTWELVANSTGSIQPDSVQVDASGSSYAVGDTGTVNGGSPLADYTITQVSQNGVSTFSILTGGLGFAAGMVCTTTATTGGGVGLTLLILTVTAADSVLAGGPDPNNLGSGYAVNDTFTVLNGSTYPVGTVTSIGAGITAVAVATGGSGHLVGEIWNLQNTAIPFGQEVFAQVQVSSVNSSGAITGLTLLSAGGGSGYSAGQTYSAVRGSTLLLGYLGGGNPNFGATPLDWTLTISTVANGSVLGFTLTNSGLGCAVGDYSTTTSGSGTGLKFIIQQVNNAGTVATASVKAQGAGYQVNDTFNVNLPYVQSGYSNATGKVTATISGAVQAVSLTSDGNNYSGGTGVATTATSGSGSGLTLTFLAGSVLRRNLFGAPNGPSGGVDHPSGSSFLFLGAGTTSLAPITKVSLDPALVGSPIYLKFTAFNQRQNMQQSVAVVPEYIFTPTGSQQGLYGFGYSVVPSLPLTQDGSMLQITVLPFALVGTFGTIDFLGTTLSSGVTNGSMGALSSSALYYVYVFQPSLDGENTSLGTIAQYAARTDTTLDSQPGWYFLGAIQLQATGGGTQSGPGGTHQPIPFTRNQSGASGESLGSTWTLSGAYYAAHTTTYNPVVPGSISIAWDYAVVDDGNGHLVYKAGPNAGAIIGAVNYGTGYVTVGAVGITTGNPGSPTMSYQYVIQVVKPS